MKKWWFSVIGFGLLLLVIISLVISTQTSSREKERNTRGSQLSQEEKQELNNLVGEIKDSLHKKIWICFRTCCFA